MITRSHHGFLYGEKGDSKEELREGEKLWDGKVTTRYYSDGKTKVKEISED